MMSRERIRKKEKDGNKEEKMYTDYL